MKNNDLKNYKPLKWLVASEKYLDDKQRPINHNKELWKVSVRSHWKPNKHRMDYNFSTNFGTRTWYCTDDETLLEQILWQLKNGRIVEIHPDYNKPTDE